MAAPARPSVAPSRAPATYVAHSAAEIDGAVQALCPVFLDTVSDVKAVVMTSALTTQRSDEPLSQARGYRGDDLFSIAEVGYHYLMNGASGLALVIFEGLAAVAPSEAYFVLGAGLAHDLEGDPASAARCYETASALDPTDPRPDINRAELAIAAGDVRAARRLLSRGADKARRSGEAELARKASALLSRCPTTSPGRRIR